MVLDVVYNHTAEGGEGGPTLSLRGLDNAAYYRLSPADRRYYRDSTGCGNTLDLASAPTLQLVLDSLRYWATEMHVDGFRFDLASSLTRDSAFLEAVGQDPVLRGLKLIAEPWDLESYQVGGFPWPWAEWNGRYRDAVRDAWHGRAPDLAGARDPAVRLVGPLRQPLAAGLDQPGHRARRVPARRPRLLRAQAQRGQRRAEPGRVGRQPLPQRRHGGPDRGRARSPRARRRLRRAHLATLLLSAGVPLLLAGDELGRTQLGNNNAYCQDNELSWLAWPYDRRDPAGSDPMLPTLVRGLLDLRRRSPVLCRTTFFRGGPSASGNLADISWFRPDGREMTSADWTGRADPARAPVRPRPAGPQRRAGTGSSTTATCWCCTSGPRTSTSRCPAGPGPGCTCRCSTPRPRTSAGSRRTPATATRAGTPLRARARSLQLLRVVG